MKIIKTAASALIVATWVLAAPPLSAAAQRSVTVQHGTVEFRDGKRSTKQITTSGKAEDAVLSPDGHTVAWVQVDDEAIASGKEAPHEPGGTSLWVGNGLTGSVHKLAGDLNGDDLQTVIRNPSKATFSSDGRYIYVESDLATTSGGVHEINLATGHHRFVVGGELKGVIRNGVYKGFLVVSEHRFLGAPLSGASYPFFVVKPEGDEVMMTPVTDDYRDPLAIDRWLKAKGWSVW